MKRKSASQASGENESIFETVWSETKNILKDVICYITIKQYCPNEEENKAIETIVDPVIVKINDVIMSSLPSCAQLKANVSKCLHFLPACAEQCASIDINDICPGWVEEWKGYKRAWRVTTSNLERVYGELREAENHTMDFIRKHNSAVAHVLNNFGWLISYISEF